MPILGTPSTFRAPVTCSRCGRELIDPVSRIAGIGPICIKKDAEDMLEGMDTEVFGVNLEGEPDTGDDEQVKKHEEPEEEKHGLTEDTGVIVEKIVTTTFRVSRNARLGELLRTDDPQGEEIHLVG